MAQLEEFLPSMNENLTEFSTHYCIHCAWQCMLVVVVLMRMAYRLIFESWSLIGRLF